MKTRQLPCLGALAITALLIACGGGNSWEPPAPIADAPAAGFTVGSAANAVAAPTLPRPNISPCVVQLFSGLNFIGFSSQSYRYTPPSNCPGPYAKIVLEADFSVTAGRQFDRTAHIGMAGFNLYTGTTQEPSKALAPSWHVERDLTEFAPLFSQAQTGYVDLDNVVDATYTGIPSGSAKILFYPATSDVKAGSAANFLYAFSAGDNGRPVTLSSSSALLSQTITFPSNVLRAYLDVVAQPQSNDEFWYTCAPDSQADQLQTCGGSAFRETQVYIDAIPAGVAPVYPWIYTGGMDPGLWRNIPSVQALNMLPYRVDLSPFAGQLNDGKPHTVSIGVQNANNYISALATLFVYTDPKQSSVSGGIVSNNLLPALAPTINNQITVDTANNPIGNLGTTSQRQYTIVGYINSSMGKETITVNQTMSFSNLQSFTATSLNINQNTQVQSSSTVSTGTVKTIWARDSSYPLVLNFSADSDGRYKTTASASFVSKTTLSNSAGAHFKSVIDDSVNNSSYAPKSPAPAVRAAQQRYFYADNLGSCYKRELASQNLSLTVAIDAATCGGAGSIARMPWQVDPLGGMGFLGPIGFKSGS